MNHAPPALLAGMLLVGAMSNPAMAANECRVEYGWTGSSGQHQVQTVNIDAGQFLPLNRSGLRYVKNVGLNDVVPTLSGLLVHTNNPMLTNGQADPPTWPAAGYIGETTLIQLQCLSTSSAPANFVVEFYKAANRPVAEIAQLVKQAFALADALVAELLHAAGFNPQQVLGALHAGLNSPVDVLTEISRAQLGLTSSVAAALLKQLGISATQLATALREGYNANEAAVAAALTQAGFTLGEVAGAMQAGFGASSEKVIEIFVQAWGTLYNETCGSSGCPATWGQRLEALRVVLGLPVQDFGNQLARVLRQGFASLTPEAVATFLRDTWNFSREQAQAALEFAGWLASQVVAALDTVYGMAEQTVAQQQLIEGIKYSQRPYGSPRSPYHRCRSHWGAMVNVAGNEPLYIPVDGSRPNITLDFRGNAALALSTGIQGLPRGTRYEITARDECSITVWLEPSGSGGGTGVAHLMIGNIQGASFRWAIGPIPDQYLNRSAPGGGTRALVMGGSEPAPNVQLGVPQPIAPLDGTTCVATTQLASSLGNAVVKLQWHRDPAAAQATGTFRVEYEVQVRNLKSNASCPGYPEELHDPSRCIYLVTAAESQDVTVPANTHFAWRVRSVLREAGGWPTRPSAQVGHWSQEQGFLSAPVAIDPPVLIDPPNNFQVGMSRGFSLPVTLNWRDADNRCSEGNFQVELSRRKNSDPDDTTYRVFNLVPTGTQTSVDFNPQAGYRYRWRVRRLDSDVWSETRTIRTSTN